MTHNPIRKEPVIQRVTSRELCKRFNEGLYWERLKAGELTGHVLESRVSTLLTHETAEIISQSVSYRTLSGEEIARVHQFVRPNGTLAASGMPDPKRLYEDGVWYRLEKGLPKNST